MGKSEPLSIDIRQLIQEIQIFEGINYNTLSGRLTLSRWCDSVLDELPLTGNEVLEFTLHTRLVYHHLKMMYLGYDFVTYPMFSIDKKYI